MHSSMQRAIKYGMMQVIIAQSHMDVTGPALYELLTRVAVQADVVQRNAIC